MNFLEILEDITGEEMQIIFKNNPNLAKLLQELIGTCYRKGYEDGYNIGKRHGNS